MSYGIAYRGYLICYNPLSPKRIWVEKDKILICWAETLDAAKRKIDELLD